MAVQSHFFSVGSVVSWAEPGVGAVATQSIPDVSFGPRGLDLMREGESAPAALQRLIADDPDVYFTTPHFDGYPAVLVRLERIGLDDLQELVVEAWLARAPKRLAQAFMDESP